MKEQRSSIRFKSLQRSTLLNKIFTDTFGTDVMGSEWQACHNVIMYLLRLYVWEASVHVLLLNGLQGQFIVRYVRSEVRNYHVLHRLSQVLQSGVYSGRLGPPLFPWHHVRYDVIVYIEISDVYCQEDIYCCMSALYHPTPSLSTRCGTEDTTAILYPGTSLDVNYIQNLLFNKLHVTSIYSVIIEYIRQKNR